MEAAWRQTGSSFWPTAGRDLATQKGRNRLDSQNARTSECAFNWDRVQGASNGKPRALSTQFLHKFKVFHPLTHHSRLPLKPLNLPSLHARQIEKRRLSAIHNFHVIILTRSCMRHPEQEIAGSVPDLFMNLLIER